MEHSREIAELIEILNEKIAELDRGMEHFHMFVNSHNVNELNRQISRSIQRDTLADIRTLIQYGL